jgi:hypothetical protein
MTSFLYHSQDIDTMLYHTLNTVLKNKESAYNTINVVSESRVVISGEIYDIISNLEPNNPTVYFKEAQEISTIQNLDNMSLKNLIAVVENAESCNGLSSESFLIVKERLLCWLERLNHDKANVMVYPLKSILLEDNELFTPHWTYGFDKKMFYAVNDSNITLITKNKNSNIEKTVLLTFNIDNLSINSEKFESKREFLHYLADFCKKKHMDTIQLYITIEFQMKFGEICKEILPTNFNLLTIDTQTNYEGNSVLDIFNNVINVSDKYTKLYYIKKMPDITHLYISNLHCHISPYRIYSDDFYKQYFKERCPERGLVSIVGVPSMMECRIFCVHKRPAMLSNEACNHYNIRTFSDLGNKTVLVFRRERDEYGNYKDPIEFCWHRYRILEFNNTFSIDQAYIKVQNVKTLEIDDEIKIQRACIDWGCEK